jgi:phosphocarrier protein
MILVLLFHQGLGKEASTYQNTCLQSIFFLFIKKIWEFMNKTKIRVAQKKLSNKSKGLFVILNDRGLHTRPSTEIVKCAAAYKSKITLRYQNSMANAKSLLGVLMLAAVRGAKVKVEAEGEDCVEAVQAILNLAAEQFHVKY